MKKNFAKSMPRQKKIAKKKTKVTYTMKKGK